MPTSSIHSITHINTFLRYHYFGRVISVFHKASTDRYDNVLVFEEINRLSREILIKTKDIIQKLGYELIYADTDSVFIKNSNRIATTDQHEMIVNILRKETGLPISIEHNFKFLVLEPLEASEKIEALKQYYGVTHEEKLVVRGVEIRRHDTPNLVK
jgi:DNA polymerase elongation subunit (family B)